MFIQTVDTNCLSAEFINVIFMDKYAVNKIIVRSNLKCMQDVNAWVEAFGKNTNTQWNARTSCPQGIKIICSKKFVCHHSSFMKVPAKCNKKGQSKNANCLATILVIIKLDNVNTRKKDAFIKQGLQAVITIETKHTHTLNIAETMRFLQAKNETKDLFFEYFNDRMTISEAKKFHEQLYDCNTDRELLLASGNTNPTYRTVQNWYHDWRKINLGPRTGKGLLEKLVEKQAIYEERGTKVVFSTEPFAVAIVTPIMARGHELQISKEICFVDSTSACDAEQHSVTFIMAPCAAGAVPLGIIITKGQTCEAYSKGFQLLQDIVSNSFHPKIFLTDHSDAEISALNTIFPNSETLLCIFHIMQAVWRWLWDSKHGIAQDDRQELMETFRKILYSRTVSDAEQAFHSSILTKYKNWIQYVQSYWNIRDKWCLAWRNETSKGHYTNNFCEISIRLFKDNVLCRVKVYNVIALIDVVSSVLEEFYKRKLREFANSRSSNARLYLLNMFKKTHYLEKSDIIRLNEFNFKVPSEQSRDNFYVVNIEQSCCSCFQGIQGKFCKHQCAIYNFFGMKTQYFPPVSTEEKYCIAKLALGNQAPPISFYKPFCEKTSDGILQEKNLSGLFDTSDTSNNNNMEEYSESNNLSVEPNLTSFSGKQNETIVSVSDICSLLERHHESFGSSSSGLQILNNRIEKITSEGQWETFLHTAGNSVPFRQRRNATIRVQPTSVCRRTPGVTKGSKRLPSGRRFKNEAIVKKRQRNLSQNVKSNKPNAKSHGFNH